MTSELNKQMQAAVGALQALAEAIRDLGSVPSGVLYANVMSVMSLESFNAAIDLLVESGLVRRENSLLTWVEPSDDRI